METIKMKHDIPGWAKERVTPMDHGFSEVSQMYRQGRAQIEMPDQKELKVWAKSNKWPTPWFGFKDAFIAKLFESDETFTLALNKSGINIHIPIKEHTLTMETLKELDTLYEKREDMGILGRRPTDWGTLVRELREIRYLVEAGIIVKVEGTETVLNMWQSFYNWAHSRYHMLEDGSDSWIGDDNS
jgi:hypothetical protein